MATALEIATYLNGLGLGTFATDIFIDDLPPDPDVCCAVNNSGGSAPDGGFGVDGIRFENPTLQILFRGVAGDSEGPRARAQTAYEGLAKIQAEALSGTQYLTVMPLQPPFILERDDQGHRVVWAFNVLIQKEPSA